MIFYFKYTVMGFRRQFLDEIKGYAHLLPLL